MKIINGNDFNAFKEIGALDVTIGAYDGLHSGHLAVIEKLLSDKKNKTAVITFLIHPDVSLKKREDYGLLETKDEKELFFSNLGIDYLIYLDSDMLGYSYQDFNYYLKKINVKRIAVGSDFVYGKKALGNIETLKTDFDVEVVDLVKNGEEKISSNLVRTALEKGDIKKANEILEHEFSISGLVLHGDRVGTVLGFKTANLEPHEKFHDLRFGVYKVKVVIDDKEYLGISNFGYNPTIKKNSVPRLETHIFNYNVDLYGKFIKVIFIDFIRDEILFNSKEELIKQIKEDIKKIGVDLQ